MQVERSEPNSGVTLLEVTVVVAVVMLLAGAIGTVFTTLTAGSVDLTQRLVSHRERHRAHVLLLEELQTTDTINADEGGTPYFEVLNDGSARFRKVEGYVVVPGEDRVTPVYGQPILYFRDGDTLLREQDGRRRVIANNVSDVLFRVSGTGTVTVELEIFAARGEAVNLEAVRHELRVSPRNSLAI